MIDNEKHPAHGAGLWALGFSALGIVFGDIGTSPLYTFNTILSMAGDQPMSVTIMGTLSLLIWTLIIVTTIKYVCFAMRIDNDGEGGILALMSLLSGRMKPRASIMLIGLLGAALIYGDGAITPAISVLSAIEGLKLALPAVDPYILPISVLILVALFCVQPKGTALIGRMFGPVMALWFLVIAALGVWGVALHPSILLAFNPLYGLRYLWTGGGQSFLMLGGIFLCATGAEALYADMGHFGARPIRLAWGALVFPSLVLNYAGQGAFVLSGGNSTDNLFFRLCPQSFMLPLVLLATAATIIASQAIITGAFSMTRQAIQLGWLPRLQVTQTSEGGRGQIYVGIVNWMLMIITVSLTLAFKKSDNLAAAYGIAVSATMLATTVLLYIAMREIWKWGIWRAGSIALGFMIVDTSFFLANLSKIADGGYVPLLLAAFVCAIMLIWQKGSGKVSTQLQQGVVPIDRFMKDITAAGIPRVPGTALFLTRTVKDAPPVMVWHVQHNRALHEKLIILTVMTESTPWVSAAKRMTVEEIAPKIWRVAARYGFMERPDVPKLLRQAYADGYRIDLNDITYYVGHETVISREGKTGLQRWVRKAFSFMQRNSLHVSEYFRLPSDKLVEIGRQIAI